MNLSHWRLENEQPSYKGYLNVCTRTYSMPNGVVADWDILVFSNTVSILALTESGQVVLAQQFRPGPNKVLTEMPGGIIEEGETVLQAAARELLEETGYTAASFHLVGKTWMAGFATRQDHIAVARDCIKVAEPSGDELEFISTKLMSLTDFRQHLCTGDVTDAGAAFLGLSWLDEQSINKE